MKKILAALAFAFSLGAYAQPSNPAVIYVPSDPTGAACVGAPPLRAYQAGNKVDMCGSGNVFVAIGSGGGGGGITALTQDVLASGSGSVAATVVGINGTLLSGLATGLLKNTTATGVPSIAAAGTDYVVPSGSVANLANGTIGQIPYQSAANTTAFLAANTAATDQVLVSHGSGAAGLAPTLSNAPALSAANMTSFPTLNQNTTGSAGSVANALTMNNGGSGAASGSTFNGSAGVTISYNTIGAGALAASNTWTQPNSFTGAGAASTAQLLINGTWFISGSATTNYPALYVKAAGAADGALQTNGNGVIINGPSGFNSSGYLLAAQINGAAPVFQVPGGGAVTATGGFQTGTVVGMGTSGSNALRIQNTGSINWSSTSGYTGTTDTTLCRASAGVIEVGASTGCATSGSISAVGIIGGSFQQQAASNSGGTCAMSSSTSCTITIGHTYTTPVCIATQQSATLTGASVGCTVSGTTVTITAAIANSETWGAFVFGNPT